MNIRTTLIANLVFAAILASCGSAHAQPARKLVQPAQPTSDAKDFAPLITTVHLKTLAGGETAFEMQWNRSLGGDRAERITVTVSGCVASYGTVTFISDTRHDVLAWAAEGQTVGDYLAKATCSTAFSRGAK